MFGFFILCLPVLSISLWVRFEHATFRSRRGPPIMWWSTVEIEGIQLQYHTHIYKYLIFINIEIL